MIKTFKPLDQEQSEVLKNVQTKFAQLLSRKTKISPKSVKIALERYGSFTHCVLKKCTTLYIGSSKLSTVDIKMYKTGKCKLSQKTGNMFALTNAIRNMLGLPARNGRPLLVRTPMDKLLDKKAQIERNIQALEAEERAHGDDL